MAKRDDPRYKSAPSRSGKNRRSEHFAAAGGSSDRRGSVRGASGESRSYGRSASGESRSYGRSASGEKRSYAKGEAPKRAYGKAAEESRRPADASRSTRRDRAASSDRPQRGAGSLSGRTFTPRRADDRSFAPRRADERPYAPAEGFAENPNLIIGRNPVTEAIKSGRTIDKILMQKDGEGSVRKIAAMAREEGLQLQYVDKIVLDKLAPGRPHQGVAAFAAAHDYCDVEDILAAAEEKGEPPLIVLLDGLEDPHNLGAILRSADGAGAHGVIIPARRSVSLTETVAKASAGAIEYVPVAKVSNLAAAIDDLKAQGIWIAAVDMDGESYSSARLDGPLAIVIGSEGKGVSRLVKEKCDFVVSIPMKGRVNSLNASNAAAVILYEAERQRSAGAEG
ncbi:MAG: 23S rRNA (guanosine(2251)-2'-O)-methyltransferase RlmB [Firmicutes bacterium]|nr:23S rRNA (guanosine(2251)-2'-O)-methyltransferase RlmB [Bacillota bacterium]